MDRSAASQVSNMQTSTSMGGSSLTMKSPWINAWRDAVIGVRAYSQSIQLSDLRGDGDFKLLVGSLHKKLIAYKGASLDWEAQVVDTPIAVATFYAETAKIPQPNIAVAAESSIYLYKNLKPYFKFNLPVQEWRKEEIVLWNQFTVDGLSEFVSSLSSLKAKGLPLSFRALQVLNESSPERQLIIINAAKSEPLSTPNTATCMEAIKKAAEDDMAISQLIIGTENKEVIILDQSGTSIIKVIRIPSVPAFIDTSGILDGEHQITVITRDSKGFVIRNGELAHTLLELESKPCGIAKVDRNLYIASMDQTVQSFNLQNLRRTFCIKMPEPITNIESMEKGRSKAIRAYLVALSNMEIRIYNEKQLVNVLKCEDTIIGMKFGTFGREDGALIILYNRLGLDVKMLQRQFNIHALAQSTTQLQDQDAPLNMPKKTKLFIEQSQRERDQAPEMYRTYMKDLFRMRLKIAQNYIKGLKEGITQGTGPGVSVRIHAQVEGIGPLFKIKVQIENLDKLPVYNLKLSYAFDSAIYKIHKWPMDIPVLVPGLAYPLEIVVENIDPNGTNDNVRIFVLEKEKNTPIVTAVVNMPVSEINVE